MPPIASARPEKQKKHSRSYPWALHLVKRKKKSVGFGTIKGIRGRCVVVVTCDLLHCGSWPTSTNAETRLGRKIVAWSTQVYGCCWFVCVIRRGEGILSFSSRYFFPFSLYREYLKDHGDSIVWFVIRLCLTLARGQHSHHYTRTDSV